MISPGNVSSALSAIGVSCRRPSLVRAAQILHASTVVRGDNHIFPGVSLFLAAVVGVLRVRIRRTLGTTFHANDQSQAFLGLGEGGGKLASIPFRQAGPTGQGGFEDITEEMNPLVGP